MLLNLIGNAVKYTDAGEVWVRLNAKATMDGAGLLLAIEVEDTGIGVGAGEQERICEPFVQSGNALSQKGTGLALSTSYGWIGECPQWTGWRRPREFEAWTEGNS